MNAKPTKGPYRWGRTTINTGTGAHEGDLQLLTDMPNPPLNDRVILAVREDWTGYLTRTPQGEANLRLLAASWEMREKLTWAANILVDGTKKEREHIMRDIRALLARIDKGDTHEG